MHEIGIGLHVTLVKELVLIYGIYIAPLKGIYANYSEALRTMTFRT